MQKSDGCENLRHCMNPNMNERTLKKVQQRSRHFKQKLLQFSAPLSLLNFETTISPLDGQEICTRLSRVKKGVGGEEVSMKRLL
jgi:hypothetical protein